MERMRLDFEREQRQFEREKDRKEKEKERKAAKGGAGATAANDQANASPKIMFATRKFPCRITNICPWDEKEVIFEDKRSLQTGLCIVWSIYVWFIFTEWSFWMVVYIACFTVH